MLSAEDKRFKRYVLDELKAKRPVRAKDLKRFETLLIIEMQDELAEEIANDLGEMDRLLQKM